MVVNKDFPDLIGIVFDVFGAFEGCNFIGQEVLFSIEQEPQLAYPFFKVVDVEELL